MNRSLPDIPKEWIQQARLADESAIEKIYSKTYPKAYTIAYYSLGATNKFQDEAQTITQDSMRKAFEKLDQLKDDDKFAPWMYTILNNSIRDYFRAHKNKDYQTNTFSELDSEDFRDNYEESIADDSVVFSPEANMNTELIAEGLKECLDKLPDNQRFALMMQMYQQLTTKEIAEQMEVEENTVKSWIRRAKLSIKDMIEELRSQNKSFYTVAPLPFLAWMLDQELKTIPSFNAKAFADGVVMEVKADTIEPQIHKKTTTNTEDELVQEAKRNHLRNASSKREVLEKGTYTKKVMFVNEKAAKLMTGGMWKVVAGVAVASLAATGVYEMVHTLTNKGSEKTEEVASNKQKNDINTDLVIKDSGRTWRISSDKHLTKLSEEVYGEDLQLYKTPFEGDTSDGMLYMGSFVGDSDTGGVKGTIRGAILFPVKMQKDHYPDKDGVYWAAIGNLKNDDEIYYVKIKDKENVYLEDLGKYNNISYVEYKDVEKFKQACGADLSEDIQMGNVEIDKDDENAPLVSYGYYGRITQLCDGDFVFY